MNRIDQPKDWVTRVPRIADEVAREPPARAHFAQLLLPLFEECRLAEDKDAIEALSRGACALAKQCHDRERLIGLAEADFVGQNHAFPLMNEHTCKCGPNGVFLRIVPGAETKAGGEALDFFFGEWHYLCSPFATSLPTDAKSRAVSFT